MKRTTTMNPTTKFGKWLLDKMIERDYTCEDVAKELGATRQAIRNHINGAVSPSFVWVVTYCWLFNSLEDINNVWYSTMEEL